MERRSKNTMFWVYFTKNKRRKLHHHLKQTIMKILDYSFISDNMLVMYSNKSSKPTPNIFQFNPRPCDVIEMAMDLDIIENVEDYDNGLAGQDLRIGFDFFGTEKVAYFGYAEVISWIGGESLEFIALRLAQKHLKEVQAENKLLNQLI